MWRKVWASAMVSGNTLVQRRSTGEGPLLGVVIEAPNQPCRIKEEKSKASPAAPCPLSTCNYSSVTLVMANQC